MKRSLLARLRSNGVSFLVSALLLLLAVPLYQSLILGPTGFSQAQSSTGAERYTAYLAWIGAHISQFLIDRALLIIAFILLLSFPYALYRIIVAQEILYQQELEGSKDDENENEDDDEDSAEAENDTEGTIEDDGMPDHAWRGKSFVVLAIWLSIIGLIVYLVGLIASTGYLYIVAKSTGSAIHEGVATYLPLLSIFTNTLGTGMLGMGILFFGAMIARTSKNLWPNPWVFFSYAGLFTGAILCISAVAVFSAPGTGQSTLTTIATLVFAAWILWLAIMLVRLKPETA